MADQKQGQKPKSPSSFWTVAEAFGSHFAEAGVGFAQSCLVRGIALGIAAPAALFLIVGAGLWYVRADMPEPFLIFGPLSVLAIMLAIWIFHWAGSIQDIEVLHRWSENVEEERSRPAVPANITVISGSAGALPVANEEEGEEA